MTFVPWVVKHLVRYLGASKMLWIVVYQDNPLLVISDEHLRRSVMTDRQSDRV